MSTAHLLAVDGLPSPSIAYGALSPVLIVAGTAMVGVVVDAFAPQRLRRTIHVPLALGGMLAALVAVVLLHATRQTVARGAVAVDGPALFLQGTILVLSIASVLLLSEDRTDSSGGALVADATALPGTRLAGQLASASRVQTEAYPLVVFAVSGMMLFTAANDLLVMFIALEVLSLPLYLLAGLARRKRLLSQEAAMKYFLLGAFASAFFIYGLALLYGYAGTVSIPGIAERSAGVGGNDTLLFLGLGMLSVGLLFKIGAAPFQAWTPDVYQGAPTPVTAFMAAGTKVAAFGALLRVFYVAFEPLRWDWRPLMWGVAILTMAVGSVLALTQRDVKRMLAYSSIAHAGFLLVGVTAANPQGLSSTMFYLVTYGFTTIGAFAVVTLVRDGEDEASDLSRWAGLGRTSPVIAGSFAIFLLALAGIPLTSGFSGKFAVFKAASEGGATGLVVVGVVASMVAAFFYFRVIVLMFFTDPPEEGAATVAIPSAYTAAALGLGLAVTVILGVFPQPLLNLADNAAVLIR